MGTAVQSVPVDVPAGDTLQILDSGSPQTSASDSSGHYAVDGGSLTFLPELGFQGTSPGIVYRITDAYGQTADGSYTPTVTAPAGPSAQPLTSTGIGTAAQTVTVVKAGGDAVTLLDGSGQPASTVTVPAQGTYLLTGSTVTFSPQDGFVGTTSGVVFRLRDAYGQTSDATYTPTVTPATTTTPTVSVGQDGTGKVVAVCALPGQSIESCAIVVTTVVNGRPVVIGSSRLISGGQVVITLTPLGQRLLHRHGSLTVKVVATVKPAGGAAIRRVVQVHLHAKPLAVPVVHFANASAVVPSSAVKALRALRGKLKAAGVASVSCIGFTDGKDTSAYNRSLGLARARAVCAIATQGLHLPFQALSLGESHPVASNATAVGRAANRRVTVQLTY